MLFSVVSVIDPCIPVRETRTSSGSARKTPSVSSLRPEREHISLTPSGGKRAVLKKPAATVANKTDLFWKHAVELVMKCSLFTSQAL